MGQTKAVVEVKAPIEKCYSYVKDSVTNPKYLSIHQNLHPRKQYSGRIVDDSGNSHLVIVESGIDSLTRIRHKGWTIKYNFEAIDRQNTRVTISVEYGIFLAIMGASTMKIQSVNDVLARVSSLLVLEYE